MVLRLVLAAPVLSGHPLLSIGVGSPVLLLARGSV